MMSVILFFYKYVKKLKIYNETFNIGGKEKLKFPLKDLTIKM